MNSTLTRGKVQLSTNFTLPLIYSWVAVMWKKRTLTKPGIKMRFLFFSSSVISNGDVISILINLKLNKLFEQLKQYYSHSCCCEGCRTDWAHQVSRLHQRPLNNVIRLKMVDFLNKDLWNVARSVQLLCWQTLLLQTDHLQHQESWAIRQVRL